MPKYNGGAVVGLAIAFQLLGLYIFSEGFFPTQISVSSTNVNKEQPAKIPILYDRFVLIVIDALRANFVYSPLGRDNFSYLHKLLMEKRAIGLVGKAKAPTVTLPRLKSLLTGSIPSFYEFVQNFNSPELKADSLIEQFHLQNSNISFYGDDTWLKLFPVKNKIFTKWGGVESFFVAVSVFYQCLRHPLNKENRILKRLIKTLQPTW